jgi:hypothetical protein
MFGKKPTLEMECKITSPTSVHEDSEQGQTRGSPEHAGETNQ